MTVRVREETFEVDSGAMLAVRNDNGRIDVERGEAGEITVRAELEGAVDYSARRDGDAIRVQAITKSGLFGLSRSRCRIRIRVPAGTPLDIRSTNGRVEAAESGGQATIVSTNGAIRVRGLEGAIALKSTNGAIQANELEGSVEARTTNGAIEIAGLKGDLKAETTNGKIAIDASLVAGSENRLATTNGGIVIALGDEPRVELSARTRRGSIKFERAATIDVQSRNRLTGRLGDGAASLAISTGNGSIAIR